MFADIKIANALRERALRPETAVDNVRSKIVIAMFLEADSAPSECHATSFTNCVSWAAEHCSPTPHIAPKVVHCELVVPPSVGSTEPELVHFATYLGEVARWSQHRCKMGDDKANIVQGQGHAPTHIALTDPRPHLCLHLCLHSRAHWHTRCSMQAGLLPSTTRLALACGAFSRGRWMRGSTPRWHRQRRCQVLDMYVFDVVFLTAQTCVSSQRRA